MCRKKSRRCDRSIPVCGRCTEKGLECGGYPQKFRFCGIASRGKWKNRGTPTEDLTAPSPDVLWPLEKSQVKHVPLTSKGQMKADQNIAARKREGLVRPVTERLFITMTDILHNSKSTRAVFNRHHALSLRKNGTLTRSLPQNRRKHCFLIVR
jgi:hypothetical protein